MVSSLILPLIFLLPGGATASEMETLDRQLVAQSYTDDLPAIRKRKMLRALVVFSRTDFFFSDRGTPIGLQVEIARAPECLVETLINVGLVAWQRNGMPSEVRLGLLS